MNRLYYRKGIFLIVATIAFASVCAAQSGRRGTSKSTTPPPPVPEAKEVEAKPPEKSPSRIQLLIAVDEPNTFGNPPSYLYRIVMDGCLQRISQAGDVVATPAANPMSRGEAIKNAKLQKEKYVVWLEVGNRASEGGRSSRTDGDEFFVGYIIFEPGTAKVKRAGRMYRNIYDTGNVGILGPASRRGIYPDQAFREAGEEAGEQILSAFAIKLPRRP